MPAPKENPQRAGLIAIGGAVLFSLVAVAGSVGFIMWRGTEERRILDARSVLCAKGERAACDLLRSACLKRVGDACAELAASELSDGPVHDAGEAVELLAEACTYQQRDACLRGGRLYLEGIVTKKDLPTARKLLDRGCTLGLHEACALAQTFP